MIYALSWNDNTVSLQLMNRPRCACSCKASYKRSVGLVGPSATSSGWGHGCLSGFYSSAAEQTHKALWLARKAIQSESCSRLRTTAAGSASTRSFIGSSAPLFYMNQRANNAFSPHVSSAGLCHKPKICNETRATGQIRGTSITVLNFFRKLGCVYMHGAII